MAKIVIDAWEGVTDPETMADELERIAAMLREGYTSGDMREGLRGWWTASDLADEPELVE